MKPGVVDKARTTPQDAGRATSEPSTDAMSPKKLATAGTIDSFFRFEMLVSSGVIELLYYVGASALTVVSIFFFALGVSSGEASLSLLGLALAILGNVLWRFVCEVGILLFRVYETLRSIDDSMATIEEDFSALSGRGTPKD